MPPGYKWECASGCRSIFYSVSGNPRQKVPQNLCPQSKPNCGVILRRQIAHLDFKRHTPFIDSVSASRSRRPSAPKRWGNDYLESARGEDDVLPDEPVRDVEPDDTEFVALQSHFQHSMRFTAAARLFFAPKTRPCVLDPNRTKSFTVSAGVARLDANGIMGCSAWQEMHVTPYTTNRHTSAEWCHLWGAGLGGPTVSTNLVAASFACNSEMYEIEALLNGKTDLSAIVKVYVDPNNNRIAEYIKYIVYAGRARRKGANDWVRWIDGRGNGFNEQDGRALSQDLSRWLRQNRSPLQLQLAQFV